MTKVTGYFFFLFVIFGGLFCVFLFFLWLQDHSACFLGIPIVEDNFYNEFKGWSLLVFGLFFSIIPSKKLFRLVKG